MWPSFLTSKAYEPAETFVFGSAILNSVSLTGTDVAALVVVVVALLVVACVDAAWVVVSGVALASQL